MRFPEGETHIRCAQCGTEYTLSSQPKQENEVKIIPPPGGLHTPEFPLSSHGDHRIAMAVSVLFSLTGGTISDAEAVKKSYPDFFEDLSSLGIKVRKTDEKR